MALTASMTNIGSLRPSFGSVAVMSNAFRGSKPPAYWKYPSSSTIIEWHGSSGRCVAATTAMHMVSEIDHRQIAKCEPRKPVWWIGSPSGGSANDRCVGETTPVNRDTQIKQTPDCHNESYGTNSPLINSRCCRSVIPSHCRRAVSAKERKVKDGRRKGRKCVNDTANNGGRM